MFKRLTVLLILLLASMNYAQGELSVVPLFNAELDGGKSYFDGDTSSSGTNLKLNYCPVLRFNEKTSLLPWLGINYSGIKTAMEITDYGNLYQQTQDYLFNLKLVHKINDALKFRAESGYKKEYAIQTREEDWGSGLYDYDNAFGGLGLEKKIKSSIWEAGYRFSSFRFPNYLSLSSQKGADLMGTRTFDNNISRLFVKTNFSLLQKRNRKIYLDLGINFDGINYPDQRIVNSEGSFTQEKRADLVSGFNGGVVYVLSKRVFDTSLGLRLGVKNKTSNQNYYDIDNLQYIPNFFDYRETAVEPYLVFRFHPSEISLNIGYETATKNYSDRLAQYADGTYKDIKAYVKRGVTNVGLGWPFAEKWKGIISVSANKNSSNIDYERYYKYNFRTSDFYMGLSYEY